MVGRAKCAMIVGVWSLTRNASSGACLGAAAIMPLRGFTSVVPAAAVEASISIQAPPEVVWRWVTQRELLRRWYAGAEVDTTWAVGSPMAITVRLGDVTLRDRGTVLAFEAPRWLRYSHWSSVSRVRDTSEGRSVITIRLVPEGGDGARGAWTRVSVEHAPGQAEAVVEHARLFWPSALHALKQAVEQD